MQNVKLFPFFFFVCAFNIIFAHEYHVSVKGNNSNVGSLTNPFKTITEAIKHAYAGDTITVHEGTYREWVNPLRGGDNDLKRIVYRAAKGEKVVIKGSEIITGWKIYDKNIWKVVIPNSFFKDYNPYKDLIFGDWFWDKGRIHHTGEVFLNGNSLYEKETKDILFSQARDLDRNALSPSDYTWFCESDENNTTIWANFHDYNPNNELVEISTRWTCFYPDKPGINFITLSGFEISQAATQWAAPTAEQIGMVSTHWNKGWIIENNIISNSKCSGITLGKERSTGHNVWTHDQSYDGSLHYIEVTFRALKNGWNKENVGSHIVRNNTISNCEQTGICGSMGAAFSTIEKNHIYNIWTKRQFTGAEIGGIKFHAAIDATIKNNRIHNAGRALWLDWMTQGTRVSGNLFYNNNMEDLFLEVNHGPFLVDNNIMLSPVSIRTQSQGGAFVHNLISGSVYMWSESNRFTPYHLPHSTEIAGLSTIYSGDDRYYNNIFIGLGNKVAIDAKWKYGLEIYNDAKLPVWIERNAYYSGAKPYENEINHIELPLHDPQIKLTEKGEKVFLHINFDDAFFSTNTDIITTQTLGKAKIPKMAFDNPDGTKLKVDKDYFSNSRNKGNNKLGPFNDLENIKGKRKIKVW